MNFSCTNQEACPVILDSKCVIYEGENLLYIGVTTNDNYRVALEKINTTIQNLVLSSGGITELIGDVIAMGPGIASATLATVNSTPGQFGSSTAIPKVTVDGKGRITAISTDPVFIPSGSLSFIGDVTGTGNTGSDTTLTLKTVNSNVYTTNNFLKFAVNAKGLITSATPVSSSDIITTLGYTPYNATNPAGYISGIDSSMVVTALGYTPYDAANPAGYISTISGIVAGGELAGTYPNPTLVNAAVTAKVLTGVNITGGSISATDSILTAFGKIQNQINGLIGGSIYQGTWNAATNTPTLTSGVGTKGYYYIVNTPGSTNLDGITDWGLGDWAIFDGTAWQQVDNTDAVVSVNGFTGAVSLTTDNIPEGLTNQYYTNTRARLALDVTPGTGISYNNGTGVFALGSIPNSSLTNSSVTINSQAVSLGGSVTLTTSDIAEGTNLYWTNARFDSRFGTKTTTDLAEGTNLYYTQARFNTAFDAKTTTDLDEGTNLYYTDARARAAFSENAVGLDYSAGSGILSLTSGYAIPTTVKLGEYDTAYNRSIISAAVTGTDSKTLTLTQQDANTITATWTDQGITTINGTANQIAATTVGNTTTVGFTNDVTFPNNVVVSGNLTINGTATYVNTQSISSKDPLFEVANDNNTTDAVDIGYYGRYYDSAQTRVEFTGLFRDASDAGKYKIFSGLVDEPTNVVDTTGTGYTVGTLVANVEGNLAGTANAANVLSTARSISATGDAAWTVNFDGSANATAALTLANTGVTASTYGTSTSVPTIAVDGKGRITSASNTAINFPVTTVNSQSGNVVLTTSDVAEGTNQYFTTGRAQSAISLTTSGTSGAATYSGGVFNIPTYIGGSGTANEIAYFSATGVISSLSTGTYPSLTELSYVKGVTSAIQTQLNTKALDSNTVHISGTETITGAKTFSGGLSSNALTLTGALNGTSATFSGLVDNTTAGYQGRYFRIYEASAHRGGFYPYNIISGSGTDYSLGLFSESSLWFAAGGGVTKHLTIASTGAATFSSSVTAGGILDLNSNSAITSVNDKFAMGVNGASYAWIQSFGGRPLVLQASGNNVGIGTSSPSLPLHVAGSVGWIMTENTAGGSARFQAKNTLQTVDFGVETTGGFIQTQGAYPFLFYTNGSERMRITSGGNVLIGYSSWSTDTHYIGKGTNQGDFIVYLGGSGARYGNTATFQTVDYQGWNAAAAGLKVGWNSGNSRSINTYGTINTGGSDYAEYMQKETDDENKKGDIVGVNANGKLTNIFNDAVSFVVKSTNPSFVGGDTWGSDIDDDDILETERHKVDRIAFSGQVPCNVLGANVGDYIIPVEKNGKISGQAVTNPTFEQYQLSVGKVWKIMEDGRAWIAVKIG